MKWDPPPDAGKDYEVKGYRLAYEIESTKDCAEYSPAQPLKYYVDVGNVNAYKFKDDPNFQPGLTYYIRILTYTTDMESDQSEGHCITIRGKPKSVDWTADDETALNEEQQQGGVNEANSTMYTTNNVPSPRGPGSKSLTTTTVMGQRLEGHRRGSDLAGPFQNVLEDGFENSRDTGGTVRGLRRNWTPSTVRYSNHGWQSSRTSAGIAKLQHANVKPIMGDGTKGLRLHDSVSSGSAGSNSDARIGKLNSDSLQSDGRIAENEHERKSPIKLFGIILACLFGVGYVGTRG